MRTVLTEFLVVIFNTILFQRRLFQRSAFKPAKKWGVAIMVCSLPEVRSYLKAVVSDINRQWLQNEEKMLQNVFLTIVNESQDPIERWQFGFQYGQFSTSEEQVRCNLQKLLRQVYSSTCFLPLLQGDYTFRIAVVDTSFEDIVGWLPIEQKQVPNAIEGEFLQLRTDICTVSPQVVYTMNQLTQTR